MRFFLRSKRFKVILGVVAGLLIIMLLSKSLGGWASPQSSILGGIITPVQKAASSVKTKTSEFFSVFSERDALKTENKKLKKQLRDTQSKILDYETMKNENDFLRSFVETLEEHEDWKNVDARFVSRDPEDTYGAFLIDKGSIAGISPKNPVITADGLVGYVAEVAPTYSKVITLLSPDIQVSAYDNRTNETGSISGEIKLAEQRLTRMSLISRESAVAIGDYLVTSGVGGVFPEGILIGTIEEIRQDMSTISRFATVKPMADIDKISGVIVITSFTGQKSGK